jgi:hypothetical protein
MTLGASPPGIGAGSTTKDPYENPKDRVGATKPSLWVVPSTALLHLGMAMRDGGYKYGPYNFRDTSVVASIYWDAKFRHMLSWLAGEEFADDSSIHHLGHDMACSAILVDAWHHGKLIDNRPKSQATLDLLKALHAQIQAERRDEAGRLILE